MPSIVLEYLRGMGREGETRRLSGKRFLVGRSVSCDFQIDSDVASRRHAVFRLEDGAWHLEDQGSSNGTILNGRLIRQATVRPGDVVTFGESGVQVRVEVMDPMPGGDNEGDATRVLRIARPGEGPPPPPAATPKEPAHEDELIALVQPLQLDDEATGEYHHPGAAHPFEHPTPIVSQMAAPEPPRRMRFPWLALLGLAFGVAVGWEVWISEKIPPAVFEGVWAPWIWLGRGLAELQVAIPDGIEPWARRGTLGLYYALIGFLLQRPLRRLPLLIVLAGLHAAGIYFLLR